MQTIELMRRVMRRSRRAAGRMLAGLALRVAERACAIAPFFLAWWWLDELLRTGQLRSLPLLCLLLAGLLAGQMLFSWLGQLYCFLGSYDLMGGYREHAIGHLGRLPLGAVQGRRSGQLASLLTDDIKRVEDIFTHLSGELVAACAVPLLYLAILLVVDWRLAGVLVITLPLALWLLGLGRRRFAAAGRHKQELLQETAGMLVEFAAGLRTLRLYGRAAHWVEKLDRRFAALRSASFGVEAWGAGPIQAYRLTLELGLVLLLLLAGALARHGELAGPAWLLFALVAYKLLDPLHDIAAHLQELRFMALSEARIEAMLAEPALPQGDAAVQPRGHALRFERVGLQYAGSASWALRDISFDAVPGSVTAIVGPSGAGKSSLLHLLARFDDPQQGAILLGGVDLRALGSERLYAQLSLVFQEVQLFDGTVLENVRIGRPGASDEEVMAACREACCDAFVRKLPHGYGSRIGENGQRLSGGERQRLSIARALLKDAPLLLLDEATASVDPQAQHDIERALGRLAQGRTVIMIAHRLRTVRHAQQILVLDGGRIVERGTHAALLQAQGLYAALWRAQDLD